MLPHLVSPFGKEGSDTMRQTDNFTLNKLSAHRLWMHAATHLQRGTCGSTGGL